MSIPGTRDFHHGLLNVWLRGGDLNPRPSGYEPDELPDCSTARHIVTLRSRCGQTVRGQAGVAGETCCSMTSLIDGVRQERSNEEDRKEAA